MTIVGSHWAAAAAAPPEIVLAFLDTVWPLSDMHIAALCVWLLSWVASIDPPGM